MPQDKNQEAGRVAVVAVEPRLFAVNDACRYLTIGRSAFYEEVRAGRLRLIKLGGATRVERAELDRWLDARIADDAATLCEAWAKPAVEGPACEVEVAA